MSFISAVKARSLKLVALLIYECPTTTAARYAEALMRAVDDDYTSMIHLLLLYTPNRQANTDKAFAYACRQSKLDIVKWFVEKKNKHERYNITASIEMPY